MTYLQIDAAAHGGRQDNITRIVLHATVSPCVPGGARNVARWFASSQAGTSAHYVIDPGETVQCLPDNVIGFHAPPNTGSIGVELCDPQSGPDSRWDDQPHRQMLTRSATLVADLCKRHNVPVAYIDAAGLLAGKRGITMHRDVSAAWRKSTHTDPGAGFPIDRFITLVRQVAGPPQEEFVMATKAEVAELLDEAVLSITGGVRPADKHDTDTKHVSNSDVLTALERFAANVDTRLKALEAK